MFLGFNSISQAAETVGDGDALQRLMFTGHCCVPGRSLFIHIISFNPQTTYLVDRIISSYFTDEPTRAKKPAQVHVAREWQRQALNPGLLAASLMSNCPISVWSEQFSKRFHTPAPCVWAPE